MKLSKAQQEVVDKMREGAIITEGVVGFWLRKSIDSRAICSCWHGTVMSLLKKGVIEKDVHGMDITFRLTEQYKTQPDSVTGEK